jgi:hypothetical protein
MRRKFAGKDWQGQARAEPQTKKEVGEKGWRLHGAL